MSAQAAQIPNTGVLHLIFFWFLGSQYNNLYLTSRYFFAGVYSELGDSRRGSICRSVNNMSNNLNKHEKQACTDPKP